MPITPDEIATREFETNLRGFDRDDVVAFLQQVAEEYGSVLARPERCEAAAGQPMEAPAVDTSAYEARIEELESLVADANQLMPDAEARAAAAEAKAREAKAAIVAAEAKVAEAEARAAAAVPTAPTTSDLEAALGKEVSDIIRAARTTAESIRTGAEDELERARRDADLQMAAAKENTNAADAAAESTAARIIDDAHAAAARAQLEANEVLAEARHRADNVLQEALLRHERVMGAHGEAPRSLAIVEAQLASLRSALEEVQSASGSAVEVFVPATTTPSTVAELLDASPEPTEAVFG